MMLFLRHSPLTTFSSTEIESCVIVCSCCIPNRCKYSREREGERERELSLVRDYILIVSTGLREIVSLVRDCSLIVSKELRWHSTLTCFSTAIGSMDCVLLLYSDSPINISALVLLLACVSRGRFVLAVMILCCSLQSFRSQAVSITTSRPLCY